VLEALNNYYLHQNSNVHRGVHYLSGLATEAFEEARIKIKKFINALTTQEIIFTRGTTESINLTAYSFGRNFIKEGDEIIISQMEHHSNIVPWQLIAADKKAKIKIIPVNDSGELILEEFEKLITKRTKLVSVVYVSNLGTVNPIEKLSILHILIIFLFLLTVRRQFSIYQLMFSSLTAIFLLSPDIKCTALPVLGFFTVNLICSNQCPHLWEAEI
jgi:selenocysteine lyase/cysteine desulfurase